MSYEQRDYRKQVYSVDLVNFRVTVDQSDLLISAESDLADKALGCTRDIRSSIESYIAVHDDYLKALVPVNVDNTAPRIIKDMADAARLCGVGPMAAVAGAVAEAVGIELLRFSKQVIVENGGDIFISSRAPRKVGIYAGLSKLSNKVGIEITEEMMPCGVCTSSGRVGHSLSFGRADAVCVVSRSTTLADAAATALCNIVHSRQDVDKAIEYGSSIKGIDGILIIIGDVLGAWGSIKLI